MARALGSHQDCSSSNPESACVIRNARNGYKADASPSTSTSTSTMQGIDSLRRPHSPSRIVRAEARSHASDLCSGGICWNHEANTDNSN